MCVIPKNINVNANRKPYLNSILKYYTNRFIWGFPYEAQNSCRKSPRIHIGKNANKA